jgi:hypothetical protein
MIGSNQIRVQRLRVLMGRQAGKLVLPGLTCLTGCTTTLAPARCRRLPAVLRPARDLLDTPYEIFRQVGGTRLRLVDDVLRSACEGAICRERIQTRAGCGKHQPPSHWPPFPVPLTPNGVSYIPKTLAEINHPIRELVDVCHLGPAFLPYSS